MHMKPKVMTQIKQNSQHRKLKPGIHVWNNSEFDFCSEENPQKVNVVGTC